MKTKKILGLSIIMALLIAIVPMSSVFAGTAKLAVCHIDEFAVYHLITISESAFPAHVAHGDSSPGDQYPGKPGYEFSDACTQEARLLTGHWTGSSGLVGSLNYTFYMDLVQAEDGTVTGTIVYTNYSATRTVTGNLVGSTLTIKTADAGYWATVSGTATGIHFYGTGTDSMGQNVALEASK